MEKNVIFEYSLADAVSDGVLFPVGRAKGLPLVTTIGTHADLPPEEWRTLFEQFLSWQKQVEPTLPEEERMFVATASNGKTVWVIDDGAAITLLYPDEY